MIKRRRPDCKLGLNIARPHRRPHIMSAFEGYRENKKALVEIQNSDSVTVLTPIASNI